MNEQQERRAFLLTESLKKHANTEHNIMMEEEREKAVKCLRQLRNLLTDDEDLKVPIHDEKFLIRFVRGKKYDAEAAHSTVRKYYTLKKKNPKIFKIVFPSQEKVRHVFEDNVIGKLKSNDPEGRPIVTWVTGNWDIGKFNFDHIIAGLALVFEEILLFSVEAQIKGITLLVNHGNMSMAHAKEFTIGRTRACLQMFQGSFPLRMKACYVVNAPPVVDIIMNAMRPFMSEKIKNRILFLGHDFEKLQEKLPRDILPENLGGKLGNEKCYDTDFIQQIFKRDSYYKELLEEYGFGEMDTDDEDTYM